MLKITYIIIFLIISLVGFGQSDFNKKYDMRGGADSGLSIVTTDSGYVVCAFSIHQNTGRSGISLIFLDINGDTTKSKFIGDTNYYYVGWAGSFRKKMQGGYYLGSSITNSLGEKYALLVNFDSNGDTLWTTKYGNGIDDYIFYHARQTSDSGYICAGIRTIGSNVQGLLIKTDSIGNIEWEQNYGGTGEEYGTMVLPLNNGGYLLGGESETTSCSAGATDQWLVYTNSMGVQQWQNCYGTINDEGNALPGLEYSNGDFLFVGQWAFNSIRWYPYLARVDNTGDTIWTKKMGAFGTSGFLRNTLLTQNGDILSVGQWSWASGIQGLLVRVSEEGDSLWYRKYDYNPTVFANDDLWDIDTAHGGGYVMCGTTNQSSIQDVWVIKVDEHGCLNDPGCWLPGAVNQPWDVNDLSISDNNHENYFSVYPNPSIGHFFIENKTGIYSDLEIRIYNPIGELLLSTPIHADKTELDISSFANGIYFITVANDDGIVWKSKLVKE